jgi:DNA replication protein DnaC
MGQRINRIEYTPYEESIAMETMFKILKSIEPYYENVMPEQLMAFIQYIHANGKGSKINIDYGKAIALLGPTGTGKTLIFNALSQYIKIDDVKFIRNDKKARFGFEVVSARNLVSKFADKGFDAIEPFIVKPVICIDDVGSEPFGQHFGNKVDIFEYLIEERYLNNRITHFSSNLNLSLIKEKYGERVYSRLVETTSFIEIKGKDWRLQSFNK